MQQHGWISQYQWRYVKFKNRLIYDVRSQNCGYYWETEKDLSLERSVREASGVLVKVYFLTRVMASWICSLSNSSSNCTLTYHEYFSVYIVYVNKTVLKFHESKSCSNQLIPHIFKWCFIYLELWLESSLKSHS